MGWPLRILFVDLMIAFNKANREIAMGWKQGDDQQMPAMHLRISHECGIRPLNSLALSRAPLHAWLVFRRAPARPPPRRRCACEAAALTLLASRSTPLAAPSQCLSTCCCSSYRPPRTRSFRLGAMASRCHATPHLLSALSAQRCPHMFTAALSLPSVAHEVTSLSRMLRTGPRSAAGCHTCWRCPGPAAHLRAQRSPSQWRRLLRIFAPSRWL